MVDLVTEGVDCVLRAGDPGDSSLTGRRIAAFDQATMASPAYLERHGVPATPDELAGHRMVAYSASASGQPYPLEFEAEGREWLIPLPYDIAVRGAELYTAAGVAGFGLFQVPRYRVEHQIAAGQLVPVLEDFPPPPMPFRCCIRKADTCRRALGCSSIGCPSFSNPFGREGIATDVRVSVRISCRSPLPPPYTLRERKPCLLASI